MSHYFIADETLAHEEIMIDYDHTGHRFHFVSDRGVFSKNHVDYATDILLHQIPPLKGRLLDLGCGYGCIGIVLGTLYGVSVTMADVNERALALAKVNAEKNHINAEIIHSDGFAAINDTYGSITLNPPIHAGKKVIYRIYEDAYEHLIAGGKFYIVIQKKHGAATTEQKLRDVFGNCAALYQKKGFFVYCCTK